MRRLLLLTGLLAACTVPASNPVVLGSQAADGTDWTAYGKDALGSRYSPLAEINRENVSSLTAAWTFHTGEQLATASAKRSLEVTRSSSAA
jgi:quinoprotein glucose dehydrogenase